MNRIFKVVFNHVLGRHVVVSEVVSSIQRGTLKVIAIAVAALAVSGLDPAYAAYVPDKEADENFRSGVAVTDVHYSTGVNSNTAKATIDISTYSASQLKTVTAGINATSAYLPNGKLVLVQSGITGDARNTFIGRYSTTSHEYTVTAKYEDGKWTSSMVDEEGNPVTKTITISENSDVQLNLGEVKKVTTGANQGYFMTNTTTRTGQVSGKETKNTATVQTGDVVKASITNRNGKPDILTVSVNGESTQFTDDYVKEGTLTTKASDSSNETVTTFKNTDGTSFDVKGENTYVAKGELTQGATDTSNETQTTFTRNDGTTFTVSGEDTYVVKGEVTTKASDTSDKVVTTFTRNDGTTFDVEGNNTYVAKAEVTKQATDTNDDVTIQLSRNDGKSFELATKNTYLADAELKDHTLTLSRNDGTEFSVKDIATLDDGMTYAGDSGSADVKLNSTVSVVGGAKGTLTDGNIGVVAEQDGNNGKLTVKLAKDIKDVDTITVNKSVTVGNTKIEDNKVTVGDTVVDNSSVTTKTVNATDVKATTVTADSFYAGNNIFNSSGLSVGGGNVTVTKDGFKVNNGPSMTSSGINAGGKKITNVAAGTAPTDAVNVSQLNDATQQQENNFRRLMHKDAQLERKIHRTGAHAAALAALHPLDFDEDHKLTASAGVGSYHGSNAVAAGVFYRPDENKMFSLGVSLNESDSMVNAGFSYRFGTGSNDKTSPNNIHELKRRVSDLSQDNQSLNAELSSTSQRLASADKEIASLKDEIAQIKKMLKGMKKK